MTTRVLDWSLHGRGVRRRGVRALSTLLLLGTTGCASPSAELETASAAAVTSGAEEETAPMSNVPSTMLASALDDAARRTSMERDAIEVVLAEPVTWSDGSLGCPQPGMMYTQALVPGYRIVLRAGEQVLNYHAGRSGVPAFCSSERVMPPASGGGAELT